MRPSPEQELRIQSTSEAALLLDECGLGNIEKGEAVIQVRQEAKDGGRPQQIAPLFFIFGKVSFFHYRP